jgi:uncharacterized protein
MKTSIWRLTSFVLAGITFLPLAQAASPVAGDWSGTLMIPGGSQLTMVFHFQEDKSGALKASFDSPDQGSFLIPVDTATLDKGMLTCELKKLSGKFVGKLNDAKTELVGEWTQNGANPLTLTKGDPAKLAAPELPKRLDGTWEGKLKANGGIELRLVVHVKRLPGGTLVLALDSPDQGANGIPISGMTFNEGSVRFESKAVAGSYEGKLDPKLDEIKGDFKQGGGSTPLLLKKTDKVSETRRTQMPKPPFPYNAEEVAYENKAGGVKLAGTLTVPPGAGPFPAALLITGSGPQDRDESLLGHKPFLVLADELTKRGIAVLRVDDRGVGGSSGSVSNSTSEDFVGDVSTGVEFLKARREIDPKRIGLIGHSEGGIIAPMVAARSRDVAFIVLMAGTALTGEEILTLQRKLIGSAMGESPEALKVNEAVIHRMVEALKAEKDSKVAAEKMRAVAKEVLDGLSEDQKKLLGNASAIVDASVGQLNSTWFRFFLVFDPRTALRKVTCPVLAVNGEKDLQVPPKENLAEIAKALKEAGNTHFVIKELPGLNHLFQTCKTGAPSEYGQIEETIAPEALKTIGDWVVEQSRPR